MKGNRMQQHRQIFRADNLGDLLSAASDWSWRQTRRSVLEVLEEQFGPDAAVNLSPEELIQFGYVQGVGHMIMQIVAGECQVGLKGPRRRRRSRKTNSES
jgi:hypothetical protein